MALASPVDAPILRPENGGVTFPCSLVSDWVQIQSDIDQVEADTGVVANDHVIRPDLITRATQAYFRPNGLGTHMLLAMKYDDALSAITDPVVRVFGRDGNGVWHALKSSAGDVLITIVTVATEDVQDGTYAMTTPILIDLQGSTEVIVGIETALAGTGTVSNATLWGKVVNNR